MQNFFVEFSVGKIVDCDISLPTIPCSTKYDGSIIDVQSYLEEHRPKGWLGEFEKLQQLDSQRKNPRKSDQQTWQVRFRQISPGVILPQQVK